MCSKTWSGDGSKLPGYVCDRCVVWEKTIWRSPETPDLVSASRPISGSLSREGLRSRLDFESRRSRSRLSSLLFRDFKCFTDIAWQRFCCSNWLMLVILSGKKKTKMVKNANILKKITARKRWWRLILKNLASLTNFQISSLGLEHPSIGIGLFDKVSISKFQPSLGGYGFDNIPGHSPKRNTSLRSKNGFIATAFTRTSPSWYFSITWYSPHNPIL